MLAEEMTALADAIAARLKPTIPVDRDLWSVDEIALYLKRNRATVRDRIVCLPRFPPAIRLPVLGSKAKGQPLWHASEVMEWAARHQDKKH